MAVMCNSQQVKDFMIKVYLDCVFMEIRKMFRGFILAPSSEIDRHRVNDVIAISLLI